MTIALDRLDRLAATALDGYLVRKDLVRTYARQYPVPTYVVEFLLGRYCASVDEAEIEEGLRIVEKLLHDRTVRTGDRELFKARAREDGSVRLIDLVKARLDTRNDCYVAELPSLGLRQVRIEDQIVADNERMLTDGFYAEVTLAYDAAIAQEKEGNPLQSRGAAPDPDVEAGCARRLQQSPPGIHHRRMDRFPAALRRAGARQASTRAPGAWCCCAWCRSWNATTTWSSWGRRGTGKSHLFQQISPYAHLVSGGKATVAKMFVNNANGQRGLVCQYDVVCFDEVAGISFDQKDGVGIMKGYMASGQFSRGKENIRAEGSLVMVGNLDVDVEQQQRIGHLLSPLPPEMRHDTAFMDRLHAFAPGWDHPKLMPDRHLTDHFGLVSDVLSECWTRLRNGNRSSAMQGRIRLGGALSGRDIEAVYKTVSGMIKLLYPDPDMDIADEDLEWVLRLALESRRRVKEQQKRVFKSEFRNTHFSYAIGPDDTEKFVAPPELYNDEAIDTDPLPPGQVWGVSCGASEAGAGLYRIEVARGPGSGVKILNNPTPPTFRESVKIGEQNLYTQAKQLVGDRDPRGEEFTIQMRPMDADRTGTGLGVPVLVALCGALLGRHTRGGTIVAGALNLGGSIEQVPNAAHIAELAIDKQAQTLLMPVTARRQLNDLPDDLWTKIGIEFYRDAPDSVFKALTE